MVLSVPLLSKGAEPRIKLPDYWDKSRKNLLVETKNRLQNLIQSFEQALLAPKYVASAQQSPELRSAWRLSEHSGVDELGATMACWGRSQRNSFVCEDFKKTGANVRTIHEWGFTMKKLGFSVAALALAISAGSALAADLPSRKAPPVAPPPAPLWKGFYAGLNAGGTWGNNNPINISTFPAGPEASSSPAYWALGNGSVGSRGNNLVGFIGGGQIGYNWQPTFAGYSFVTGAEADIQGIAGSGNGSRNGYWITPGATAADMVSNFSSSSGSLQYLGTVRGRLGWLATPTLLIYGTGGLAYGGVSFNRSTTTIESNAGVNQWIAQGNTSYSNTQVGWTAGGGLEWMFMPNWSAKAEYLFYDLGKVSATSVSSLSPLVAGNGDAAQLYLASTYTTRINANLVRAGVNYHFNWGSSPVVAKY